MKTFSTKKKTFVDFATNKAKATGKQADCFSEVKKYKEEALNKR